MVLYFDEESLARMEPNEQMFWIDNAVQMLCRMAERNGISDAMRGTIRNLLIKVQDFEYSMRSVRIRELCRVLYNMGTQDAMTRWPGDAQREYIWIQSRPAANPFAPASSQRSRTPNRGRTPPRGRSPRRS